jgi:hypothetical protein
MTLPITSLIAALLGVLAVPLSIYVTLQRVRVGKATGELPAAAFGPHPEVKLTAAIRAHGNLMEYAPMGLVLIGLAEANDAQTAWLLPVALAFAAGRWLHAFAMLTNPYPPALRGIAMVTTYVAMGAPAVYLTIKMV